MDQVALEWTCDTHNNKKIGKEVKREGKELKFVSGKKKKNKRKTLLLPFFLPNQFARISNPKENPTVMQRTKYPGFNKETIKAA